jgi:thioredoxin 1
MSHANQVSFATFGSEVLESSIPVVVDFYADWCAPCRTLSPMLDHISKKFER